ncbi:MAG TPA: hypothetical protein VK742_01080 [Candidatus Sulfotelmatobacter sp.]|nr:hypothetical protein [Candidatus Sulfotelmatobacter sp.]
MIKNQTTALLSRGNILLSFWFAGGNLPAKNFESKNFFHLPGVGGGWNKPRINAKTDGHERV